MQGKASAALAQVPQEPEHLRPQPGPAHQVLFRNGEVVGVGRVEDGGTLLLEAAADVAVGEDAHQPARLVDHRHRPQAGLGHAHQGLHHRVGDQAGGVLGADDVLDLGAHEPGVLQELGRAQVGELVVAEALHDAPRHGAHVHAGQQGLLDVLHVADRREHHLGRVVVGADEVDALLEQADGVVALVLQPPGQGAHERGPRGHGHVGLVEGVNEVDVDPVTGRHQRGAGPDALVRHRDLEHRLLVEGQLQQAGGLGQDLVVGLAQGLDLQLGHHLRQLDDGPVDVGDPVPAHEGGGGGEALHHAQRERLLDLPEVDRVEVEVHVRSPLRAS